MRLLLDTHALLWWLADDPELSAVARAAIREPRNDILVSAVSAWEIAAKVRIGRLPTAAELAADIAGHLAREGFAELPVSVAHAQRAGGLPIPHADPFDRMLIAQAHAEGIHLVTKERFDCYGVTCLW